MYYKDLREYLNRLEEKGKLVRVKREINKDTELMCLVRWQFRGLPEEQRRAFLFENVTDVKGKRCAMPVAVATLGASQEVYALAMNCKSEEIGGKWVRAQSHPLAPVLISNGPVQQVVKQEEELEKPGAGLEALPIPISLPGLDPAPFISAGCWVTKDPDTGVPNIGTYRAQVKSRTRTGLHCGLGQHLLVHWQKAKSLGRPLEAAVVIGGPPNIGLVSISKIPYETDELAVAGAIAGEPVPVVKCKSVNLEVPAYADIVLEGVIPTDSLEPEAPFGEYTGYMGRRTMSPCFEIKCITHRRDAIYHAFISQFPPSESDKFQAITEEANLYKFLKFDCNLPGVLEVALHEASGTHPFVVIRLKKLNPGQPWQALLSAAGYSANIGKYIITVDDDINPRDLDAVIWALSFRTQPHLDSRVIPGKIIGLDPSAPPGGFKEVAGRLESSALLIDATIKNDYPPVSLPRREFMEKAKEIWEELGLASLTPKHPWHGYFLGPWSQEYIEEAEMALQGDHFKTGEKHAVRREQI